MLLLKFSAVAVALLATSQGVLAASLASIQFPILCSDKCSQFGQVLLNGDPTASLTGCALGHMASASDVSTTVAPCFCSVLTATVGQDCVTCINGVTAIATENSTALLNSLNTACNPGATADTAAVSGLLSPILLAGQASSSSAVPSSTAAPTSAAAKPSGAATSAPVSTGVRPVTAKGASTTGSAALSAMRPIDGLAGLFLASAAFLAGL